MNQLTYFHTLPPEINEQFIQYLPTSQLYELCQTEPFFDICDWNFWRRKCKETFGISFAYFDLALDRQINGSYRYLEISSRFLVTWPSLASVNDGLVSGVYDLRFFFVQAVRDNQIDIVQKLYPYVAPETVQAILKVFPDYADGQWYRFLGNFDVVSSIMKIDKPPEIFLFIERGEWDKVNRQISEFFIPSGVQGTIIVGTSQDKFNHSLIFRTFACLIQIQKDDAFALVQKYFDRLTTENQILCFRACLQCGNENQAKWIFRQEAVSRAMSSLVENMDFVPSVGSYIGRSYSTGLLDEFGYYISDAYFGGNPNLVELVESIRPEIRYEKFSHFSFAIESSIVAGYNQGFSNPENVYNLFIRKPFLVTLFENITTISSLSKLDIDLWLLLRGDNLNFSMDAILNTNFVEPGNVDLLNTVFKTYVNAGSPRGRVTKDIIEYSLSNIPPDLPVTQQIIRSYLPLIRG